MWTDAEIYKNLTESAAQYGIFQCEDCADEMQQWLKKRHIDGICIKLRAVSGDFIISERTGGDLAIAQNGNHYGIEVRGIVFDNLPNTGLLKQDWLDDFDCIGGFTLTESPF